MYEDDFKSLRNESQMAASIGIQIEQIVLCTKFKSDTVLLSSKQFGITLNKASFVSVVK